MIGEVFHPGHGSWIFGLGPFGVVLSLMVLFFLVYVLYKVVRSFRSVPDGSSDKSDSLSILKTRFAKGDISLDEYQKMRQLLIHE